MEVERRIANRHSSACAHADRLYPSGDVRLLFAPKSLVERVKYHHTRVRVDEGESVMLHPECDILFL